MAELNVNIGNLQLKNPVMTASGTFGYGVEYSDFMDISRLGGIFVKGTTIQPREGNLYPRMAETPSGMLNAVGLQNKGAQYFVGKQDFASVRSQGTPVKSTVRTIFWCEVEPVDDLIRIRVCGDGFLYNMVRAIAGTLTYVGGGKLAPEQVRDVLLACDREQAGPTLPACGLFMNRLWYDDTPELDRFRLSE